MSIHGYFFDKILCIFAQVKQYLNKTFYFDFEHKAVQDFIAAFQNQALTDQEKSIGLYQKVRDTLRYDPYNISFIETDYKASTIAQKPSGNCVEKSILLIAGLRAMNIPARLHLGKVKNHIAAERLIEKFNTNELTPHGMVNVYLNDKWLKLSPAFNASLCEKYKVAVLEFDGKNDSYLQQYNNEGALFMEYTQDYGHFDDVPLEFMKANLKEHYPHIFDSNKDVKIFRI